MDMLKITGLYKRFGNHEVLKGLDLSVPEHSVFGFVGKNGSGKTTTMKTILGLIKADGGEITVAGEKVVYGQTATNQHIGYLPDVPEFYDFMTPREYLVFCGEITGMEKEDIEKRADELLRLVGLDKEERRIKGFSRGMKQRLGIAQALFSHPKLLICDEPTSALDPMGRKEILDILYSVRNETTVLFSTHVLADVERICTDVAFIDNGVISIHGKLEDLKASFNSNEYLVEPLNESDAFVLLEKFGGMQIAPTRLVFKEGKTEIFDIMNFIAENKIPVVKIERFEKTLESMFMEVVTK